MSFSRPEIDDGSTRVGRYRIYGEIAAGGMATLHIGRLLGPAGFSRTVAIKRLHPQFAKDPEFVAMLLDEARLAARIVHPNVVSTLDVVAKENELFLVMDYVAGESMAQLLRKSWAAKTPPSPAIVASLATDLLLGLHAAHQAKSDGGRPLNIVHRDVSPQNLLVGVDGVGRVVDFGVAKAMIRSTSTRDGKVKGKLAYMSPEQIQAGPVDHRSDIFSAGVVIWEALAGKRLFSRPDPGAIIAAILTDHIPPPSEFAPNLPGALDAVVLKALSKHPDERYGSASEMAEAVAEAQSPAGAVRVGQWVKAVAGETLSRRAQHVADVESQTSNAIPLPLDHDDLEATRQSGATDHTASIAGLVTPAPRRGPLLLGIAALLLIATSVAGWALWRSTRDSTVTIVAGPPATASTASLASPPEPPATEAPTPATATAQEPTSTGSADTPAVPAPLVQRPRPSGGRPKPTPAAAPAPTPAPSKNCNPPYTIDSQGEKVFKPECF
ncbi:MAG: serine/threonine-protein kinase [Polyangiaceae bacterium]